MHKFNTS